MSDPKADIWITSRRAQDDAPPVCLLSWDGQEKYVPVPAVRQVAEDLMTCAAYADLIGELLRVGLPGDVIEPMVAAIASKRDRKYFGAKGAIFLRPGGSSARKQGAVMIAHRNLFDDGKYNGSLSPDQARTMARRWFQAAEASESDTLFDKTLRRAGWLSDADLKAVFDHLYDIRKGQ